MGWEERGGDGRGGGTRRACLLVLTILAAGLHIHVNRSASHLELVLLDEFVENIKNTAFTYNIQTVFHCRKFSMKQNVDVSCSEFR